MEVLDDGTRERLDRPVYLDELTRALRSFGRNKTPGSNGLPVELYSALWDLVGQDLLEVYDSALRAGEMCKSVRKGIITLIYKRKGEREEIKNWRLISLLNVDYKILAKVVANRV
eukprot:g15306.t1